MWMCANVLMKVDEKIDYLNVVKIVAPVALPPLSQWEFRRSCRSINRMVKH